MQTLLIALALLAQEPTPTPVPAPGDQTPPVERLEEWPELSGSDRDRVRVDVERLRKARVPEMGAEAEAALVAAGAAAAPELLPVLGKEKDPEALARARRVLAAICGPEHTRLLARSFDDRAGPVRTEALLLAARHPDAGVRAQAEKALQKVLAQKAKADPRERYAAALCATSAGSTAGLDVLADEAVDRWDDRGPAMRVALEQVRGPEATGVAAARIDSEDRKRTVAALNLLAGCGDASAAALVRPHLDSKDHQVRVAAINALRGIVDGEPPLEKLPVFEAIELAKKWKTRG